MKSKEFDRRALARQALEASSDLRREKQLGLNPFCVYDLAESIGLEVQFEALDSLEGLYAPEFNLIIIGSRRPSARRRYTCAHEIGHDRFGHGTSALKHSVSLTHVNASPEEFLVQAFAGFLLMPRLTVEAAFRKRDWNPLSPASDEVYRVATELGVGYSTLLNHMNYSLGILESTVAEQLSKVSLPKIRQTIAPNLSATDNLVVLDEKWGSRPIDLEVGDVLLAPSSSYMQADGMQQLDHMIDNAFIAIKPGIGSISGSNDEWCHSVRISRREYSGRACYRHLEE